MYTMYYILSIFFSFVFHINYVYRAFECYHIKHRSIIESDWETLKNNFLLEYLNSCGTTQEEAATNFKEAAELFFVPSDFLVPEKSKVLQIVL